MAHQDAPRACSSRKTNDWGTCAPIDPSHPRYVPYHHAWQDWWTSRGYDPAFGQKLPALFERCGLEEIQHEAATEIVRGGSPWARWWAVTLDVMNEQGGGGTESYRPELATMTAALADPSSGSTGSCCTVAAAGEAGNPA